ncbi:uncharacterized protein A4U43_C02F9640 [Asparagus officinalis]|uniref:HAUS augmin-like complex subunit 6 N-terminal domain-containing protein n=1 Tax=Asparagus officinalis TaxID=4686 RepID=A0A5P1FJ15_ASPOF|nr:uncharacterized protein A4U43_C02F9640 [Asparagus officinalis]
MATEREKEREAELESAMYTNCLLLGLDPAILGNGANGTARVGHFRHSNPKMGEQLLYFLLSALRGPVQSAKASICYCLPLILIELASDCLLLFDFRRILIRCGRYSIQRNRGIFGRFVELLWQLSVHALREVHRRTFAADVASNPLPASLTDVSYLHAASLLPVTKARIALERRKFLKNANAAVQRQTAWSNLAHEMTAEFRGLCAEEAYLQQELEKLQDIRNKSKLEVEPWDDRISSSSAQNSHLVSKATRLWESLLARKSQHEVLASGPIEDLIAHREHRYRISGTSLLAAMDLSSHVPYSDVLSVRTGEISPPIDSREPVDPLQPQGSHDALPRTEDRSGRVHPTVDVAEVLRRWTHALQRIHKQSLHLAKANDGEGPELLRCASDGSTSGHAESLEATLAEHRQHLASIQGLINQLKEAVPVMQKSIADLTEEVNSISPCTIDEYSARSSSPVQAQSSGRSLESSNDEVNEMISKLNSIQLEKGTSSPALKLPHLFSLTPNSSGKSMHTPKRQSISTQSIRSESLAVGKPVDPPFTNDHSTSQDSDSYFVQNLRRSVREAALLKPVNNTESSEDKSSDDGSEHFFMPLATGVTRKEVDAAPNQRKQRLFASPQQNRVSKTTKLQPSNLESPLNFVSDVSNDSNGYENQGNGFPTDSVLGFSGSTPQSTFPGFNESTDQVFSPPLLMDSSFFPDAYEDLLAPLSDTDAALMEK